MRNSYYLNLINLRKLAIKNHFSDDIELYIDKCYRHYSKTYNTPLADAYKDLTPEEVLLIYFCDEMEEWTPEEVEKIQKILSTADVPMLDPGYSAKATSEISDDEWILQQEKNMKAEQEKKAKQQEDIAKKTHEAIEQLTQAFKAATPTAKKENKIKAGE